MLALEELLARFGSVVVVETVAVLSVVTADLMIHTVMVIVAESPGPIVPSAQVSAAPPMQLPSVVVTFWNFVVNTRASFTDTALAFEGPLLTTVSFQMICERSALSAPFLTMLTSARAMTPVVMDLELLPELGSEVVEDPEIVFESVEPSGALGLT